MNLKNLLTVLLALAATGISAADTTAGGQWIDMTALLLKNPGFANNSRDGWQWQSNAGSQTARCDCMEFWNGTFDIYQQVTGAAKGRYRLSVQAYYRCEDNGPGYNKYLQGTHNITGYMYGAETQQKLVSVYDAVRSSYADGCWSPDWQRNFYPNTMESARVFFDEGKYWNSMEFEAGGDFRIGLRCQSNLPSNWCIFDNFRLEYYGDIVQVSSISLSAPATELVVGEQTAAQAVVAPADATVKNLTWKSSDERVATVGQDGVITATGTGTATITAAAVDGSGKTGSLTVKVVHNAATSGSVIINEIMASNVDEYVSPAFNFDGWVELYNPTDRAVELAGLLLSDTENGEGPWQMPPTMGVVPAHGFRLVWFDSNDENPTNAPFKLDTDGGTIVISTASGSVIASQAYPPSAERISYARATDGTGTWGNTATPTPGASNNGVTLLTQQLAAPVVDQPSQLFSGRLSVNVTIPAGTTLRYTTDGTLPTLTNGQTGRTGQFSVSRTTCYRFRLFADDMLPSRVTTRSYIERTSNYTLPVVSVVTDPDFLYGQEMGVMTTGPNGRPGRGRDDNCNWNRNWERPVNFSYLDANGEMVLNQDVNLEMCGGWSRAWTPHAFKLKGNKELGGDKNLLYPFFSQKPYIRNRTLQIRNGGNDNGGRFKDPSLQYIMMQAGVNIDCQSYQPVHEFINGEYIGVLNMREPNNKHFVYANYGWDDDEIDLFEMSPDSGYVQKCGTPEAFNELVDVLSPDAANAETYKEIARLLDIDAYANYMAAEMYLCNWDWPQNNVKGFRHRDNGRFRFVLFDLDGSFGTNTPFDTFFGKEDYWFDQLRPASLGRIHDRIRFVTLFKNMLKNADFRRRFIDAYCIMGGSVYEKNRAAEIISQLLDGVEQAMNLKGESSAWSASDVRNNLNSRLDRAATALHDYATFQLNRTTAQSVQLSANVQNAVISINGLPVPTGQFNGKLFAPATLRVTAPAGYVFTGWKQPAGNTLSTKEEVTLPTGSVNLTASFRQMTQNELAEQHITPVRINEVSGSNDSYIDEYGKKGDWVELYNTTGAPVDVEGMYLTDNLSKLTKYQITKGKTNAQTVIPAYGHLVVWCDNKRATTDNGLHATFKIDGDGGQVALTAADRSWTDVMSYGAHDASTTVVRYPDGTNNVYTSNVATIGRPNLMTSYLAVVDQSAPDVSKVAAISAANGFRLCYGSQQLLVKSDEGGLADVSVYTADGALVEQQTVALANGTTRISVAHLAAGFYVARATNADGVRVSCKFLR